MRQCVEVFPLNLSILSMCERRPMRLRQVSGCCTNPQRAEPEPEPDWPQNPHGFCAALCCPMLCCHLTAQWNLLEMWTVELHPDLQSQRAREKEAENSSGCSGLRTTVRQKQLVETSSNLKTNKHPNKNPLNWFYFVLWLKKKLYVYWEKYKKENWDFLFNFFFTICSIYI